MHPQASDTRKSIHLSASAGSGKTRALKDRYLALLDDLDRRGLSTDQAVAITFTDKAAAEIKERVLRDLPESMLRKIIRGRQDLRISTIHSFCMNLLKRYPLEAGLPPDFGVLDARDQAHRIRKAAGDALETASRDSSLMAPLSEYTADELAGDIEYLLSIRGRLTRMEIDAGGPEQLVAAVRAGTGFDDAVRELDAVLADPAQRALFREMEAILSRQGTFYASCRGQQHQAIADASANPAVHKTAQDLAPVYFTQQNSPRKKPPVPRAKFRQRGTPYETYDTLYFRVQESLARLLLLSRLVQAGAEAVSLLRIFQQADARYRASNLREGLLDFDDLEIYAYRLLRSSDFPDILYWLDRRILHFLVDEFQDTSDIQWAIVNKLTEEFFSGQGAEKGAPPTLFVVGDEKQSIYRFREANYRLIDLVRARMESDLPADARAVLTLDRNYRSAPPIVETVNSIF
ncbi:MAG TPA: UvrD-helicase domain-containing protein, partial [Nitrospirota bacterium]|nr:UvrD-helicase domain-containing protein [Nitrospirota bacterium]